MKRRSFLAMLGLAPVAAVVPSQAKVSVWVPSRPGYSSVGFIGEIAPESVVPLHSNLGQIVAGSIRSAHKSFAMNLSEGYAELIVSVGEEPSPEADGHMAGLA
jgi:hypothetical protein